MSLFAQVIPGIAIAEFAASVLVQTTAVILFAALVSHTFLRRSPAGRHAVWLGALVCVLASPLLAFTSQGLGFSWLTIPVLPSEVAEKSRDLVEWSAVPVVADSEGGTWSGLKLARGAVDGFAAPETPNSLLKRPSPSKRGATGSASAGTIGQFPSRTSTGRAGGTHSQQAAKPGDRLEHRVVRARAFFDSPSEPVEDEVSESLLCVKLPRDATDSTHGQTNLALRQSFAEGMESAAVISGSEPEGGGQANPGTRRSSLARPLASSILALWALGAAFLAVRLLHGWSVLYSLRRTARPVAGRGWDGLYERVCQTLDVPKLPPIVASGDVASPMAAGVWKPVVLLPQCTLKTLDFDGLHDVLVHECAHVLRHDHLIGLAQRVAEMLFWPHPLVHFLNRQLSQAREEVCDNYVLRRGDAPGYARTLLGLSEQFQVFPRSPVAVGLITPRWKLEQRVAGLLSTRRNRMARTSKRTTLGIVAGFTVLGIALMGVRFVGATEEETAAPKSSIDQKEAVPAPVPDDAPDAADGAKPASTNNTKESKQNKAARKDNGRKKDRKVEKARRAKKRGLEVQERIRLRVENEIRPLVAELEKEIELNLKAEVETDPEALEEDMESALERIGEIIARDLTPAIEELAANLERDLKPALETLGKNLERDLTPALEKLSADFGRDFSEAFKNFGTNFERELGPALEQLGRDLERDLKPALENLGAEIERELKPVFEELGEEVLEAVEAELEELGIEFEQGAPAPVPVPDAPKVEPGAAPAPPAGAKTDPNTVPQPGAVLSQELLAKAEAHAKSKESQEANKLPEFEERMEKTFPVKAGGLLTLDVDRGHVTVEAVDEEEVAIEVVRKVRAKTREEAAAIAGAILKHHEIQFLPSGDDVRVVAELNVTKETKIDAPGFKGLKGEKEVRKALNRRFQGFSYRIKVPHQYNVDLKTAGGHIKVSDLNGEVRTQTAGGHLNLGNITGTVWARTSGGHIKLAGGGGSADVHTAGGHITIGDVNGEVLARTSGGHVRIGRAKGSVVAKTSGGHIRILEVPGQVEATTSGGHVDVTISEQPSGDCTVSTSGGNVKVRLAEGIRATLDAKTSSGRVHSDLSIQPEGRSKKTLSGDLNGGGPKLVLRTSAGNVRLLLIQETAAAPDQ